MDKEYLKKLAGNPQFIPGVYNYCDRWCERCAFTSRCMTYALSEDEVDNPESQDITNKAFWDKLHEIFQVTLEMVRETAEEMGIDLNAIDREEIARQEEQVHKTVEEQPYTKAAFAYAKMVDKWFDSSKELLEDKAGELRTLVEADVPGTMPADEAVKIRDCLEVVRWYQHQIYVKLCRAASGLIRGELEDLEYAPEDANGSAKVAIIGIERSIAAWGGLLNQFPQQEHPILDLLVNLKRLLRQVEAAFPDARAFVRPGFDC
jgi:predicted hydrocarbon binding protein